MRTRVVAIGLLLVFQCAAADLSQEARDALRRAVEFYHSQVSTEGGYHFNYIFDKAVGQMGPVIMVRDPQSGRTLQVSTTQPGVQFYSGNNIPDHLVGKNKTQYGPHLAFCLETQHYPDSPNHPHFPPTVLRPGETYDHVVIYRFGTVKK